MMGRQEGLTLGAVLGKDKDRPPPPPHRVNKTLLDIISQEDPNCRVYRNLIDRHQNNKGWKFFKDKLRLKRGLDGDMWAAGVPVPAASDVAVHRDLVSTSNAMAMGAGSGSIQRPALAQLLRDHSVRVVEQVQEEADDDSGEVPWAETGEVHLLNQSLSRVRSLSQNDSLHIEHVPVSDVPVPIVNSLSSMLAHNLSQIPSREQSDEPVRSVRLSDALAAEREHMQLVLSSTEPARSNQDEEEEEEATETNNHNEERDDIGAEAGNEQQQVRMSLMDLLEETESRQIGWSSYAGDVDDYNENNDEGNEYGEDEGSNFVEQNCCVCMVRHKGSAFIPCGHTFCRLCSRELWVKRGNCPICNGFILEILDIF